MAVTFTSASYNATTAVVSLVGTDLNLIIPGTHEVAVRYIKSQYDWEVVPTTIVGQTAVLMQFHVNRGALWTGDFFVRAYEPGDFEERTDFSVTGVAYVAPGVPIFESASFDSSSGVVTVVGTDLDQVNTGWPDYHEVGVGIITGVEWWNFTPEASTLLLQASPILLEVHIDSGTLGPGAYRIAANLWGEGELNPFADFDHYGWVPIADWVSAEVDSNLFPSLAGMVLCELWSQDAVTTKARLRNTTHSQTVGTSRAVASATPATADFSVFVSAGTDRYRLEVGSRWTGKDLFCIGAGLGV